MVREVRFTITGEVRKPKAGDWFLNTKNVPICAAQDFDITKFPILKMEITEDPDVQYSMKQNPFPICVRK
ncbi:MAG TPA: hypothetical protein VMT62_17365 [Syntrophorhabdaceae bacterium]|nr:hypothetical protein [Syntrophorhabdaceae bacterium]